MSKGMSNFQIDDFFKEEDNEELQYLTPQKKMSL